jgi:hypothetical protein
MTATANETKGNAMALNPLTIDSAPEQARPLLEKAKQNYGFVPNLLVIHAKPVRPYASISHLQNKKPVTV